MTKQKNTDRFKVEFVKDAGSLEKSQRLRGEVFFGDGRLDEDEFDKFCEHLVVIDNQTTDVIGTYRLLLGSVAQKNIGFYSETEFDLKNIRQNCRGEILEMGRACVKDSHRRYPIINLLWKQIIMCIGQYDIKYIIGCSSIEHPNPQDIGRILKFLKDNYIAPEIFSANPLPAKEYKYVEYKDSMKSDEVYGLIPSLIKGYLKMGAFVCGDPVWDREFDTADLFMLLDTEKMDADYRKKFL